MAIEKGGVGLSKVEVPEGFDEVSSNNLIYKPEECKDVALQGILFDYIEMPEAETGKWFAFVIKTTKASKAVNRDKEIVATKPGDMVLIPATAGLSDLRKYARLADFMVEVFIQPKGKRDLGKGKSMWDFKTGINPKTRFPREGAAILGSAVPLAALPAASEESYGGL